MTHSLDSLNTFGTELSGDQLAAVDGGLAPLVAAAIWGLAGFDIVIWGAILSS